MSLSAGLNRRLPELWQKRGLMSSLLLPLATLFGLVTGLRALLFRLGVLASVRVGVPVIVVGNITVGGSGKTPVVIWLVEHLRSRGFRPGVISRGYGRRDDGVVEVKCDTSPAESGDEPLLIARRVDCPVFVGRDRVAAARALLRANPSCNLIISDDGLQHYRLARDAELVVFDTRGVGNGWLLPAGPLREPVSRACLADAVIANGELPPALRGRLQDRPVFSMALQGTRMTRLADGHEAGVETFRGRHVHAIAGIGNPQRFFDQLRGLGLEFEPHAFADHHDYRIEDLAFAGAQAILMTEKDAVKCASFANQLTVELWALRVDAGLSPDPLPYLERLLEIVHGSATS